MYALQFNFPLTPLLISSLYCTPGTPLFSWIPGPIFNNYFRSHNKCLLSPFHPPGSDLDTKRCPPGRTSALCIVGHGVPHFLCLCPRPTIDGRPIPPPTVHSLMQLLFILPPPPSPQQLTFQGPREGTGHRERAAARAVREGRGGEGREEHEEEVRGKGEDGGSGVGAAQESEAAQGGAGSCGVHSPRLPQPRAESGSVRRRKDEASKQRQELPRSRRFSRPLSQRPMSFKHCLPPPKQATNALQDLALRPAPYLQLSSPHAGLAGPPIARRVESRAPSPSPCSLLFQIILLLFGEAANGASNTASRTRLALPPGTSSAAPPPGR